MMLVMPNPEQQAPMYANGKGRWRPLPLLPATDCLAGAHACHLQYHSPPSPVNLASQVHVTFGKPHCWQLLLIVALPTYSTPSNGHRIPSVDLGTFQGGESNAKAKYTVKLALQVGLQAHHWCYGLWQREYWGGNQGGRDSQKKKHFCD